MTWIHLICTWNPRDFFPKIDEFSSFTSTPRGFDEPFFSLGRGAQLGPVRNECRNDVESIAAFVETNRCRFGQTILAGDTHLGTSGQRVARGPSAKGRH